MLTLTRGGPREASMMKVLSICCLDYFDYVPKCDCANFKTLRDTDALFRGCVSTCKVVNQGQRLGRLL